MNAATVGTGSDACADQFDIVLQHCRQLGCGQVTKGLHAARTRRRAIASAGRRAHRLRCAAALVAIRQNRAVQPVFLKVRLASVTTASLLASKAVLRRRHRNSPNGRPRRRRPLVLSGPRDRRFGWPVLFLVEATAVDVAAPQKSTSCAT